MKHLPGVTVNHTFTVVCRLEITGRIIKLVCSSIAELTYGQRWIHFILKAPTELVQMYFSIIKDSKHKLLMVEDGLCTVCLHCKVEAKSTVHLTRILLFSVSVHLLDLLLELKLTVKENHFFISVQC